MSRDRDRVSLIQRSLRHITNRGKVVWVQTMTRVGAVVTEKSKLQEKSFSFFIPTLPLATSISKKVSHVYLQSLTEFEPLHETSFLINLPLNTPPERFLETISQLDATFVVAVPVVEDWHFWTLLRRFQSLFDYVLIQTTQIEPNWIQRYMCLRYLAVVANEHCEQLAMKGHEPDLLLFPENLDPENVEKTKELARNISSQLRQQKCLNYFIDPLQPLTQEMLLEVYETFERDTSKYEAYDEAIDLAFADLMHQTSNRPTILVVGPGRGPLLAMAAKYRDKASVIAVERNTKCISKLKSDNSKLWEGKINIYEGDIRSISKSFGHIDMVISELLGSFGCNEACPEVLTGFERAIMIPQTITCFLRPIYCSLVDENIKRPYLLKSDQEFVVGAASSVFHFDFPGSYSLDQVWLANFDFLFPDVANALQGYFKADLYGHISISNMYVDASTYVCSFWYPMIFPIKPVESRMAVTMARRSDNTKLWYEWSVDGDIHNQHGDRYSISLA